MLVRLVAAPLLGASEIEAEQLDGLCKLTWITIGSAGVSPSYISSTKIPGLESALSRNYKGWALSDVAENVASTIGSEQAKALILEHTGFTNFY